MLMKIDEVAQLHKAFSVPVRLQILKLIAGRSLCVNAITGFLEISQPAVSQHLAILRYAGLVVGEKHGYRVHYRLNRERLEEFRKTINTFPEQEPHEKEKKERLTGRVETDDRADRAARIQAGAGRASKTGLT